MAISLLEVAHVNGFVLFREFFEISYSNFRKGLSRSLLDE